MMQLGLKNEDAIQADVVQWARKQSLQNPELKWLFHVANGGSRHPVEAMRLKALGVVPGITDLVLPTARGGYFGLWLEFKNGNKGKPSDDQVSFHSFLKSEGYCVGIIRSFEEGKEAIEAYLTMKRTKIYE